MKKLILAPVAILGLVTTATAEFVFIPSVTAGPREDRTGGVPNSTEAVSWPTFTDHRMNGLAAQNPIVGSGHAIAKWREGVNYRELLTTRTVTMSKLWLAQLGGPSDPSDFGNRTHFGGTVTTTNGWKIRLVDTKFRVRSIIGPESAPVFGNIDTTAVMDTLGYFRVATGLSNGRCDRLDYGGVGVGFTVNDTTSTVGAVLRYCYQNNVRFLFTTTVVGEDASGNTQTQVFESTHRMNLGDIVQLEPTGGSGSSISLKTTLLDPTLASAGWKVCIQSSSDLLGWTNRADITNLGENILSFADPQVVSRQFYRATVCPVSTVNLRSGALVPVPDVVVN